jgi:hypothetical protein
MEFFGNFDFFFHELTFCIAPCSIITAFTIESADPIFTDKPNKDVHRPIRGIMTTYGYCIADPHVPNRETVWITGGRIEPNDADSDREEWRRLFAVHPPHHSLSEQAKLLAVKLLMGAVVPDTMASDGAIEYVFTRPLGGHSVAFLDTLYMDDSLRIGRGHRGTVFVFTRLPVHDVHHKK